MPNRRKESLTDIVVQSVGLASAVIGGGVLLRLTLRLHNPAALVATVVYGVSLATMFVCSLINTVVDHPERKPAALALDHAAIYLLIAGTYTPFCLLVIGDGRGKWLLAAVWAAAAAGMLSRLLFRQTFARARILLYVLLGWSGLVAADGIVAHLPALGSAFLLAGGLIYTLGAPLHRWTALRYHGALWHGCVLAAACCHYGAIVLVLRAVA